MEELTTQAIAEFDADTRFRAMAAKDRVNEGPAIPGNLDISFLSLPSAREDAGRFRGVQMCWTLFNWRYSYLADAYGLLVPDIGCIRLCPK